MSRANALLRDRSLPVFRGCPFFRCLVASSAVLIVVGLARADAPAPSPKEAEARRLLEDVAKAYKDLAAYSDRGEFRVEFVELWPDGRRGKMTTITHPARLRFARPNKIDLDIKPLRVICDGKILTTVVETTRKYTTAPAPDKLAPTSFAKGPLRGPLFGGEHGMATWFLLAFLLGDDPVKLAFDSLQLTPKIEPDREHGGRVLKSVLLDYDQDQRAKLPWTAIEVRLLIDPGTKLLDRIEVSTPPPAPGFDLITIVPPPPSLPEGVTVPEGIEIDDPAFPRADPMPFSVRTTWVAVAAKVEAPAEGFAYRPPDDFTKAETFAELVRREEPGR